MKPRHISLKTLVEDFISRMAQAAGGGPLIPHEDPRAKLPDYEKTDDPSTEITDKMIKRYHRKSSRQANSQHFDEPYNHISPTK